MSRLANVVTVPLLTAGVLETGTVAGDAVDLRPYSGEGRLVLNVGAGETEDGTITVTIQESDDGSAWASAGIAFAVVEDQEEAHEVLGFNVDARKRYIRASAVVAGTDAAIPCAAFLIAHRDGD